MPVKIIDRTSEVRAKLGTDLARAATAVGEKMVELVLEKMEHGYHTPHKTYNMKGEWTGDYHTNIRSTGNLEGDVKYTFEDAEDKLTVAVGNSLDYAIGVHDGTSTLEGRPYLRDAISEWKDTLMDVFRAYMYSQN